jgi:hypothetical protein
MATRKKIGSFKVNGKTNLRLFVDTKHTLATPKRPHSSIGTFFKNIRKFDCFGLFRSNAISPKSENPIVETSGLPDNLVEKKPHRSSEDYMSDKESTEAVLFDSSSTIDSEYWSRERKKNKSRSELLNRIDNAQNNMRRPAFKH